MKKVILISVLVLGFLVPVFLVSADMRSDHKRIDAGQVIADQKAQVNRLLSRMTDVKTRLVALKAKVNSQIGATEAAEVQAVIDGIKTQYADAASAW